MKMLIMQVLFCWNLVGYQDQDWYGLTEFYCGTSSRPLQDNGKPKTVGKPFPNVEIKVVHDNGVCVPYNTQGEIWLRGYCVFLEYHNQPELSQSMITSDGWFKTGDCGVMDEDGDLEIVGRITTAERIKICGDVVYLPPIENALREHPKIKESCVVGVPDISTGHQMVYSVVPKTGQALTIKDIQDFAMSKLYQYQWPWRVLFFESLPKTGSRMKLDRKAVLTDVECQIKANPAVGAVPYFDDVTNLSAYKTDA